ncbi:MAG: DNA polymerase I [Candidatus Delongbacteria bacterium]|nr:DNA polymerase I [Candidatus Delongbacteria bacterium]
MERLFIIDGTALAYRSYYAFSRPLVNSKGRTTTVAYVFLSVLHQIRQNYHPEYLAVTFDKGKPTFRHQLYPDYKSTREKMPDEMAKQLPMLNELLDAMQISVFEQEGIEADDIIATLARRAEQEGIEVIIVSGDKDLLQLVNENIKVLRTTKGADWDQLFDIQAVTAKFEVPPDRIRDYLAIAGDSSDHIPGIPGLGPIAAKKLLHQYPNLEQIYQNLEQIKPDSLRNKLIQGRSSAELALKLVALDEQVPLAIRWPELKLDKPVPPCLPELLKEWEFTRFLGAYQADSSSASAASDTFSFTYQLIADPAAWEELKPALTAAEECAIDVETDSLDPFQARLAGVSLCFQPHQGYYLPLAHTQGSNLPAEVVTELRACLKNKRMIGQNIKFDDRVLARHGVILDRPDFDTMIASYLLNPDLTHHSLDHLAQSRLHYAMLSFKDVLKETGASDFSQVPPERAAFYSVEDVVVTFHLKQQMEPQLEKNGLIRLFRDIEMPLMRVLGRMETNGVYINRDLMQSFSHALENELQEVENKIYTEAGQVFNINSPKQLSGILFERLNLPGGKKTKTGYSTDVTVLEELSHLHPLPALLLEYRQLSKLKSTYADPLLEAIDPASGLVHPSFNQTVAATGRLSCSNPNLQNVPIRTEKGKIIRQAFQTREPDNILISADYSQIELRVLAHLSGDETLISAFTQGLDIHSQTAALIYGIPQSQVTADMRRQAKTINFGIIYGMGSFSLARELSITRSEAEKFIQTYFDRFPRVRDFIDQTIRFAGKHGYVTTLFNRRRFVPEINSSNFNRREFARRIAVNTPVQGSAADIIKKAMLDLDVWIRTDRPDLKMILQIHDELIFECPESSLDYYRPRIGQIMEECVPLRVPLQVDIGSGPNWLSAH